MSKYVDKFLEEQKPSSGWNDGFYCNVHKYLTRFENKQFTKLKEDLEYIEECLVDGDMDFVFKKIQEMKDR